MNATTVKAPKTHTAPTGADLYALIRVSLAAALAFASGCAAPVASAVDHPAPVSAPALPPPPAPAAAELPPSTYSVAIDPGFSLDDVAAVVDGIRAWEAVVPVHFDLTVAACAGQDVCIVYGPANYTATPILYVAGPNAGQPSGESEVTYTGPLGECSWSRFGWGGRIQLDITSAVAGPIFQNVVEHELGHAMGLVHHDGANVMSSAVTQSIPISADDVAQWVDVHEHGPAVVDGAPQT